MFFEINKQQSNIITVDPFFAELVQVSPNGDMKFNFTYSVNQIEAIEKKLSTVKITVFSKTISKASIFDGNSNQNAINNLLKQSQNAKNRIKQQESFIIATKYSDITSKLNNEVVTKLQQNQKNEALELLTKTRLKTISVNELSIDNDIRPLFQFMASDKLIDVNTQFSSSINLDVPSTILELLKQGIDPSDVTMMSHRSISAKNSFEGISRKTRARESETDKINQLLNSYLMSNNRDGFKTLSDQIDREDTNIQITKSEIEENIELTTGIVIPNIARKSLKTAVTQFFVKFEIIDSFTKSPLNSITKLLDVTQHIKLFNTPLKPPVLTVVSNKKQSFANLQIKQNDENATSISLYKKNVNTTSVEPDEYVLIKTLDLKYNHETIVTVEKPNASTIIYRAIATGDKGFQSSEYTNIVLNSDRIKQDKSISVISRLVTTGVEIEISQFPPLISHIEILTRDLTLFEKEYQNIDDSANLITEIIRESGTFSLIHLTAVDYHVYEYIVKITYKNGTSEYSQSSIIEKLPYQPGKVDINISNLEIENELDIPNVKFKMSAKLLDTDVDVITSLLEKRGIKDLFLDEIKKQRSTFKDLFVFNVERLNLTTGIRENFGTIIDDDFDDVKLQRINSVKPLSFNNRYQYEVSISLRSIETVFESLVKTSTDVITNKSFNSRPAKGLHPVTLRDGIVVSEKGLQVRYPKDVFTHGKIGFFESIDVTFDKPKIEIIDINARKFDRHLNMLSWKVIGGNLNKIDHFLIMKDVHGTRTVVGKCHNNFEFGNFQLLHETTGHDRGELRYIILMILNDYSISEEFISNVVVV